MYFIRQTEYPKETLLYNNTWGQHTIGHEGKPIAL